MDGAYWVYVHKMITPLYYGNFERMIIGLAGVNHSGMLNICMGKQVYPVNARVMNLICNNYILKKPTTVSFCGESFQIETIEHIQDFLWRTKASRFFVSGDEIKTFVNPILKG